MYNSILKIGISICLISLFIASCDSGITSDNQSTNNALIESSTISSESALSSDVRKVLAGVRSVTSAYHKVDNAIADGYVEVTPFLPDMGYHLVNFGLVADGVIDPYAPEALVYIHNPADASKRRLVAVEYIYPVLDEELDITLLDDMFPGVDGDQWYYVDGIGWTLHAWVWYPNPDGIFYPYNSRVGDGS